jgi:enterochelin esterase family protein
MMVTVKDLRKHRPVDVVDLEKFARETTFPVVDGTTATFLYRGAADDVLLRHWIYGLSSTNPFERIPGTDYWTLTMDLPAKSRVEYKLEVVHGDQHRLVEDPLNPNRAHDPYGSNSVVFGSGYVEPDWVHPDSDARPGEVVEHMLRSDVFREPRPFSVYLPARFRDTRRYPLLVVHDGEDFLRFAKLKSVLDNLIHRLEIPPMVVALTQSGDRLREYADDERHARFLVEELVPGLEEKYPLVGTSSARALMGASFGAVASLAAAWRYPGFFNSLLLQSGSFAFTDIGSEHDRGPLFDPIVEFVNAFRENPGKPVDKVYLSCGIYESLIYYNRSMVPFLERTGMEVRYHEARDGHNWENWRDRLREALSWLFPGPLWMVYE